MNGPEKKGQDEFRSAVIMTVVWVAGLTLVVIFLALFAGILLDKFLDSKPLFTVIFIVTSIPLTIYLTFRVVKAATRRIQPATKKGITEEEPQRGKDN
jgi:F0F1-type ATP synthase assembly protein I